MYGETGAVMREEFAALLRQHRVQQRLVGPTSEDREVLGGLIRAYRQTVLVWLGQAMRAASPLAFSNMPPPQRNPFRSVGAPGSHLTAAGELARAIDLAKQQSTASPASTDALATPNANPMVDHWRLAARAAALAEHDTSERVSAQMTTPQAQALVGDAAALTQALVVLDQRYKNTPGWEPLSQSARLGWASLAAALDVNLGQPDYAVDHLGWRPKTKVITGTARPGVLGVLQAQHNLVVRMRSVPNATNLRLVVDSQRLVSAHLAPYAARIDERLAERWTARAETYSVMQKQLREVGGLLGRGGLAVAEGANAVTRLKALPKDTILEPRVLSGFQLLFHRLDDRIADVIEDGVERGAFFKRVTLPRIVGGGGQLVHPVRERFVPITSATDLAVVKTVRERLRPKDDPPEATPGPTRVDLHSALIHRPTKGRAVEVPNI
ncbi:hypothetical protein [Nocardioides sp. W7]|uniref:hypothetical protein n=1 Tax=Nocardioides sp. W7 TaxID=2931390 RepID=UPI001FD0FABE|nr:hypothetical protein [Nocardioides sp. W7]